MESIRRKESSEKKKDGKRIIGEKKLEKWKKYSEEREKIEREREREPSDNDNNSVMWFVPQITSRISKNSSLFFNRINYEGYFFK